MHLAYACLLCKVIHACPIRNIKCSHVQEQCIDYRGGWWIWDIASCDMSWLRLWDWQTVTCATVWLTRSVFPACCCSSSVLLPWSTACSLPLPSSPSFSWPCKYLCDNEPCVNITLLVVTGDLSDVAMAYKRHAVTTMQHSRNAEQCKQAHATCCPAVAVACTVTAMLQSEHAESLHEHEHACKACGTCWLHWSNLSAKWKCSFMQAKILFRNPLLQLPWCCKSPRRFTASPQLCASCHPSTPCRSMHNCMIAAVDGQMMHACAALLPERDMMRERVVKASRQDTMMVRTNMVSIGISEAYRAVWFAPAARMAKLSAGEYDLWKLCAILQSVTQWLRPLTSTMPVFLQHSTVKNMKMMIQWSSS